MRIIENQKFVGVTVYIDDTLYLNCTFETCTLIYGAGDGGWRKSRFVGKQNVVFIGAAQRVHTFMKLFGMIQEPAPEAPIPESGGFVN